MQNHKPKTLLDFRNRTLDFLERQREVEIAALPIPQYLLNLPRLESLAGLAKKQPEQPEQPGWETKSTESPAAEGFGLGGQASSDEQKTDALADSKRGSSSSAAGAFSSPDSKRSPGANIAGVSAADVKRGSSGSADSQEEVVFGPELAASCRHVLSHYISRSLSELKEYLEDVTSSTTLKFLKQELQRKEEWSFKRVNSPLDKRDEVTYHFSFEAPVTFLDKARSIEVMKYLKGMAPVRSRPEYAVVIAGRLLDRILQLSAKKDEHKLDHRYDSSSTDSEIETLFKEIEELWPEVMLFEDKTATCTSYSQFQRLPDTVSPAITEKVFETTLIPKILKLPNILRTRFFLHLLSSEEGTAYLNRKRKETSVVWNRLQASHRDQVTTPCYPELQTFLLEVFESCQRAPKHDLSQAMSASSPRRLEDTSQSASHTEKELSLKLLDTAINNQKFQINLFYVSDLLRRLCGLGIHESMSFNRQQCLRWIAGLLAHTHAPQDAKEGAKALSGALKSAVNVLDIEVFNLLITDPRFNPAPKDVLELPILGAASISGILNDKKEGKQRGAMYFSMRAMSRLDLNTLSQSTNFNPLIKNACESNDVAMLRTTLAFGQDFPAKAWFEEIFKSLEGKFDHVRNIKFQTEQMRKAHDCFKQIRWHQGEGGLAQTDKDYRKAIELDPALFDQHILKYILRINVSGYEAALTELLALPAVIAFLSRPEAFHTRLIYAAACEVGALGIAKDTKRAEKLYEEGLQHPLSPLQREELMTRLKACNPNSSKLEAALAKESEAEHKGDSKSPAPGAKDVKEVKEAPITKQESKVPELKQRVQHQFVQLLLEQKTDLNRALYWTISRGDSTTSPEAVSLLLELGANVKSRNFLKWACHYGYTSAIPVLLEHGADPNLKDKNGCTPLMVAIQRGHSAAAEVLIRKGKDKVALDLTKDGTTALMQAVEKDDFATVELLLSNKASPDLEDSKGNTALLRAAATNKREAIATLVEYKANIDHPNIVGETALGHTLVKSSTQTARLLLELKANPNVLNAEWSLLGSAANTNQLEMARLLLRYRADIEQVDVKETYGTPLQIACGLQKESYDMVQLLLQHGAKIGREPSLFFGALKKKHFATANLLLEYGVRLYTRIDDEKQLELIARNDYIQNRIDNQQYSGEALMRFVGNPCLVPVWKQAEKKEIRPDDAGDAKGDKKKNTAPFDQEPQPESERIVGWDQLVAAAHRGVTKPLFEKTFELKTITTLKQCYLPFLQDVLGHPLSVILFFEEMRATFDQIPRGDEIAGGLSTPLVKLILSYISPYELLPQAKEKLSVLAGDNMHYAGKANVGDCLAGIDCKDLSGSAKRNLREFKLCFDQSLATRVRAAEVGSLEAVNSKLDFIQDITARTAGKGDAKSSDQDGGDSVQKQDQEDKQALTKARKELEECSSTFFRALPAPSSGRLSDLKNLLGHVRVTGIPEFLSEMASGSDKINFDEKVWQGAFSEALEGSEKSSEGKGKPDLRSCILLSMYRPSLKAEQNAESIARIRQLKTDLIALEAFSKELEREVKAIAIAQKKGTALPMGCSAFLNALKQKGSFAHEFYATLTLPAFSNIKYPATAALKKRAGVSSAQQAVVAAPNPPASSAAAASAPAAPRAGVSARGAIN